MSEVKWILVALSLYVMVLGVITWRSRSAASGREYVLGGRRVGILGTTSSQIVSIFDGTGFVMLVMLGITIGYSLLWVFVAVSLAYVVLAFQSARVRRLAGARRYLTVSDMLRDRAGSKTATLSALMVAVGMFLSMAASVHVSGIMFSSLLGVPNAVGVVGVSTVIVGYLLIGGYQTVIRTDILQWAVVSLFAVYAYAVGHYPDLSVVSHQVIHASPADMWALPILMFCVNYAYVDSWQRIFSSKDERTASRGTLLTAPVGLLIYSSFIVFGASIAVLYPDIPAADFVYQSLSNPAISPEIGLALGFALLALIMSTLDSRAYTVASTTTANLLAIDPDESPRRYIRVARMLIVAMFAVLCVIAIFITDVVRYIISTDSIFAVFAPVFFSCIVRPEGTNQARFDRNLFVALLVGATVWAVMLVGQLYQNYFLNLVPIGASAVLCVFAVVLEYATLPERMPVDAGQHPQLR